MTEENRLSLHLLQLKSTTRVFESGKALVLKRLTPETNLSVEEHQIETLKIITHTLHVMLL